MLTMLRSFGAAALVSLALGAAGWAQSVPDHPPGSFSLEDARGALSGDAAALSAFVDWSETPQGPDFWTKEIAGVASGGGLSPAATDAISSWITAAEDGARSAPPRTFVRAAAVDILNGDGAKIPQFVTWTETPQGRTFWRAQYDRAKAGAQITPLARRIIENWVAQSAKK